VLGWIIRWTSKNAPTVNIEQTEQPLIQNNDAVWSWTDIWTGSSVPVTGEVESWAIDDTELPLDKNAQVTSWTDEVPDPEVEEIIDLLEELIAESETEK
jgi:hypothetical protein